MGLKENECGVVPNLFEKKESVPKESCEYRSHENLPIRLKKFIDALRIFPKFIREELDKALNDMVIFKPFFNRLKKFPKDYLNDRNKMWRLEPKISLEADLQKKTNFIF